MTEAELVSIVADGVLAEPEEWMELPLQLGVVELWRDLGRVRVRVAATAMINNDDQDLLSRSMLGVQAAVAAASGNAVVAQQESAVITRADGSRRQVGVSRASYDVTAVLTPQDLAHGAEAAAAVLGEDRRLAELWEVYVLGLRGAQSVAPVVGFWAFSTVVEETAPKGKYNLDHVPALVQELTAAGFPIGQAPARNPNHIRASALHPTPTSPLPTTAEVNWFGEVARAYLLRRATQKMVTSSQMPVPPTS